MKRYVITAGFLIAIAFMLLLRLHLGIVRFFDPDEFAHIHWAWLIASGHAPYRDFFFYILPIFQWLLVPIFLFAPSVKLVMATRMVAFVIYVILLFVVYRITKQVTGRTNTSLLAMVLFAGFPMTIDKTIDVRPDTLMTLLYFFGVSRLLRRNPLERKEDAADADLFFASIAISLSMLVMLKIVFAIPAIIFLYIMKLIDTKGKGILFIILGGIVPVLILVSILAHDNLIPLAYRALTVDAWVVNNGKEPFSLIATLSPWPLVYIARAGISVPWITNTVLWGCMVLGLCILIIKKRVPGFFSLLFLISSIAFLIKFPVPYVQYFIPVSVVASLGAAVAVIGLADTADAAVLWLTKKLRIPHLMPVGSILMLLVAGFVSYSMYVQYTDRLGSQGSLHEQQTVISDILRITKPDEPVYDMNGSYVFRPDGYYICCHPYNEFLHRFTRYIGPLKKSLLQTKTKFLVMDQKGYVFWYPYPSDLAFMAANYTPSNYPKIYVAGVSYQCKERVCDQLSVLGGPVALRTTVITLPFHEQYRLKTEPAGQFVVVGRLRIADGQTTTLSTTPYHFEVPTDVTGFTLKLDR
jgi:hypothetical protein